MTFQNIIEEIQEVFPNVQEQRVRKDINIVQRDYCNDTRILKDRVNLFSDWEITEDGAFVITEKAGHRTATEPSDAWRHYILWNLESIWDRINHVYRVLFLDADGKELYNEEALSYEIWKNGFIKFYNYDGSELSSIPSGIVDIQLHFFAHPRPLRVILDKDSENYDEEGLYSELLDEPEFDVYHEAIVHGVLRKYYSRFPTVQKTMQDGSTVLVQNDGMLRYHTALYEDFIRKGSKHSNIGKDMIPITYTSRGF